MRSDLPGPGEELGVQQGPARVERIDLTGTPGPRLLAAAVGVPGLGELGRERACRTCEGAERSALPGAAQTPVGG